MFEINNDSIRLLIIICIVAIVLFFLMIRDYYIGRKNDDIALQKVAIINLSFFLFCMLILFLSAYIDIRKKDIKNDEIIKIETALQTGELYYNNEQIPADRMTPDQIYSDFSYSIVDGNVYVYTK